MPTHPSREALAQLEGSLGSDAPQAREARTLVASR